VGGVPYESGYSRQIKAARSDQIILPGPIYDKELLNELWCHCYAYIHGNEVGGTNPALLQTMANGCFTIAIDVPFSRDVLRDGGIFFAKNAGDLAEKMRWTLQHPDELPPYCNRAIARIQEQYSWETVTDGYETLFFELAKSRTKH